MVASPDVRRGTEEQTSLIKTRASKGALNHVELGDEQIK